MKVIGVIGSANFSGNGATLVREALKAAEAEGVTTKEIFLPQFKIEFCQGCMRCMAEGKCHQADDFEALRGTLYEADGIRAC
jgi:multimeric flavodoxin WrbA